MPDTLETATDQTAPGHASATGRAPDRHPQQREEFTVMFADVSDSTGLYERLGDIEAQFVISQCIGLISDLIKRNSGKVLKTAGDDVMALFDRPEHALKAAVSVQEALAEGDVFEDISLATHIGVHTGLGLLTEGDVFGDIVNVAARLCASARREQILTTRDTVERLPANFEVATRPYDRVRVRGREQPVEIYEVLWKGLGEVTGVMRIGGEDDEGAVLKLRNCGLEFELTPDTGPFVIGRDLDCNLTVNGTEVSRHHAIIEYRRGKFILRDQSTNGSYIRPLQGKPFYIRREEVPLTGEGEISLGKAVDDRPALNIFYRFV